MTNRIGALVALGFASLLLAGCAGQRPATWVEDVCNIHASWISSDRPQADEERLTNSLRDSIPESSDGAVADSARAFINAAQEDDRSEVESADEQLVAACKDSGWEPAEG
ncbi:hypothetical protein [Mycetocola sp. 2940]|uniref:hypothetical protein n=1 Tax=Mycetocola sp. 2940 TaxID=3156452 RepID=UPI003395953A